MNRPPHARRDRHIGAGVLPAALSIQQLLSARKKKPARMVLAGS
jgi:hypothetical protein